MFRLHERLAADCIAVTDLSLSSLLLMNNRLFPWLVLVPRVENAQEIIDLSPQDRMKLMEEISQTSEILQTLFKPQKLNVASLGNQVPMLHVHVIARFNHDPAWPNPVWGEGNEPYTESDSVIRKINALL